MFISSSDVMRLFTSWRVSSLTLGSCRSNAKFMLSSLPVMSITHITFTLLFWLNVLDEVRSRNGTEGMVWWQMRWMLASNGLPLNTTLLPSCRSRSRKMMSCRYSL